MLTRLMWCNDCDGIQNGCDHTAVEEIGWYETIATDLQTEA